MLDGVVFIGAVSGQLLVIAQRLWAHTRLQPRVLGQRHRNRWALTAGVGMLIDEVAHRPQMRGVFAQSGCDRRLQSLRTVRVE